jgi:TPR repeat protein
VEAVKWAQRAADQSHAEAQCLLSICYGTGEGVPRNYVQAYKWASLASAHGLETAKPILSGLEQYGMTAEQIAEGQRLAREFKPTVARPVR